MGLFDRAVRFAAERHGGMIRKQGGTPYILHPLEAAVIAGTITADEEVLAAAVLHDTVEDTDTAPGELARLFGPRVAFLVASETENKYPELPPDVSWRIRKEESLAQLRDASDQAVRILWLADKLSNLRSIHRAWKVSGDAVWQAFHQSDPVQQAWYYRSIDVLLSGLQDCDAWQEFHTLVQTIFPEEP